MRFLLLTESCRTSISDGVVAFGSISSSSFQTSSSGNRVLNGAARARLLTGDNGTNSSSVLGPAVEGSEYRSCSGIRSWEMSMFWAGIDARSCQDPKLLQDINQLADNFKIKDSPLAILHNKIIIKENTVVFVSLIFYFCIYLKTSWE